MATRERPLSPHLQIYRLPMTAMLSILHRATGVFLVLGSLLLVYWLLALAAGPEAYAAAQALFGLWIVKLALFGWSLALFLHLCNGIRHLFWDAGYGYDLKTSDASGYAVIVATLVLTVIAWAAGLVVLNGGGA